MKESQWFEREKAEADGYDPVDRRDFVTYLYDKRVELKELIQNRNNRCGDYDINANYEEELARVEQEIYEKIGKEV